MDRNKENTSGKSESTNTTNTAGKMKSVGAARSMRSAKVGRTFDIIDSSP
jgi:hypothetical protein